MNPIDFTNPRGLRLAGTLCQAGGDPIVVMAHGFMSNKNSRGRFPQIMTALKQAGYSSLAFDFSGCGASADDTLTVGKQVEDLRAAVAYARGLGYRRVALYGHSLGGLVALRAYDPEIEAIVVTGALTGPVAYAWQLYFSKAQFEELKRHGRFALRPWGDDLREQIVVETQTLEDFANIDQKSLLSRIHCPTLVIHGDADAEELWGSQISAAGMKYLPAGSRLEIINGAPHNFMQHMHSVVELLLDFLRKNMPLSQPGDGMRAG